jgi:hypothetical protein
MLLQLLFTVIVIAVIATTKVGGICLYTGQILSPGSTTGSSGSGGSGTHDSGSGASGTSGSSSWVESLTASAQKKKIE